MVLFDLYSFKGQSYETSRLGQRLHKTFPYLPFSSQNIIHLYLLSSTFLLGTYKIKLNMYLLK